jgi:cytochrome c oxidase subunit III
MAGAKNHDYHILPPSIWPFYCSMSALISAAGLIMFMHEVRYGGWVLAIGLVAVLYGMYAWWSDVIKEAHAGDHTPVVQLHQRYGMILFIASEVMLFVGFFWAWFDFSLFPTAMDVTLDEATHAVSVTLVEASDAAYKTALAWPPKGIEVIDAFHLPLLNTLILLCSGTTVTWAHHALIHGDRESFKKGLWLTIGLGVLFSCIQFYEYAVAPFPFKGLNYSAAFYLATGLHGFHVAVGTVFLAVCLYRGYRGHFTPKQHFGFEAAAWYWHFVDVVWLFLFIAVYVWGGWGAPVH